VSFYGFVVLDNRAVAGWLLPGYSGRITDSLLYFTLFGELT